MTACNPIPDLALQNLSTRARNVLVRNEVLSCEALLRMDERDLGKLWGCGRQTVHELRYLQADILRSRPDLSYCTQRPGDQTTPAPISDLPQWSILNGSPTKHPRGTQVPDRSLYWDLELESFEFLEIPGFRYPALLGAGAVGGAAKWGEVAKITERTVIERLGCSATAFEAVAYLWRLKKLALLLCKASLAGLPADMYREFNELAESCLAYAIGQRGGKGADTGERDYQLLKARFALLDGRRWTLEKLGRQEGLSRERIRQIEARVMEGLKTPEALTHLSYLWVWVDHLLLTGGGVRSAREITEALGTSWGWTVLPHDEVIAWFIALSPAYQVLLPRNKQLPWNRPTWIVMAGQSCPGCHEIRRFLSGAVAGSANATLSSTEAIMAMRAYCVGRGCAETKEITGFSTGFLGLVADSIEGLVVGAAFLQYPNPD